MKILLKVRVITTLVTTVLPWGAFAADAPPPPDGVWIGKVQGGLVLTSGNTDSTAINVKLDLAETEGPWKNIVLFGGLYGKSSHIQSAEHLEARYELDHKIDERLYWFGAVDGNRDRFSGFAYQATLSAGVGYKFIDDADTKLSGQAGLGYQRFQTQQLIKDPAGSGEVIVRINGPVEGTLVGVVGVSLEQKLTDNSKMFDKLQISSGAKNTAVSNDLGMQVNMSDRLAVSFGYGIRYNTDPAAGVKKTDQVTTANIVYNIQ